MSPRDPMTSRRDLLRLMGPVCAGLAAAGCVPRSVRHGLRSSVEDTLRAFGATVVPGADPVSYTHLRAHETDSYLVCRLLLEKKK